MTNTKTYIKEWQQALQNEISYLKKYGGNKERVTNGHLLTKDEMFTYYFDTSGSQRIPVGSAIRLEWGGLKTKGRVLSSEGKGVILALEKNLGDLISDAFLIHDPWELLEQLIERFDEIKKNKTKRLRVKRLMDPSVDAKHPTEKIKSNVHELILRSKYNPVTFVWGPPGTGKTHTLARVTANKYFQEKRVLVLSHSNQAVDVLIGEISAFIKKQNRFREGDVLRYGTNTGEALGNHTGITTNQLIEKLDPELSKQKEQLISERRNLKQDLARSFSQRDSNDLLEIETKIARLFDKVRQRELELLKEALIVGTTLAKASSDGAIYEKDYDLVILDEASMAYVPQAAYAATLGKRVIICGDYKQLPPIASSRDSLVTKWLKEDVFHRAGVATWVSEGTLHPHLFLLKEQRRMHPDISAFTNRYIYQSLVTDHETVFRKRNEIVAHPPFPEHASILLDTSYTGAHCINEKGTNSRLNPWQLLLSFQLIHEAYLGGATSIGYVTPYRAQANLMQLLLEELYQEERLNADIIAATVHKFQGSERDVMIFDTVDSAPQTRAGMLLIGKDSERLINVAITRTRGKFIHVSNEAFIRGHVYRDKTLRQLVDHQVNHKRRITTKEIGSWIKSHHPNLQWMHARKLEYVFKDIMEAKAAIVLSLPEGTILSAEWKKQLVNRQSQVKLVVISNDDCDELNANQLVYPEIPFPFIIIDKRLCWLGIPLEGARQVQPPYVAARLESKTMSEYILGQVLNREA